MSKSVQRGVKASPRATSDLKAAATGSTRAERKSSEKSPASRALTKEKQASLYSKAMKLFSTGNFAKAREGLEKVIGGPSMEMAHAARMHHSVCERRLASVAVQLRTPNEQYDYAVALLNGRKPDEARGHLEKALEAMENADHVHYALALCLGQLGDIDSAAVHLNRAISLDPRNRNAARNDPDFGPFQSAPQIRALLTLKRTESD